MKKIFLIWSLVIVLLLPAFPVSAKDSSQVSVQKTVLAKKNAAKKKPAQKKKTSKKKSPKVYWTPGGSTYHCSKNCPILRRSRVIRSSSKSKCPKKHACKFCY